MTAFPEPSLPTRLAIAPLRLRHAQILLCDGGACGRCDRGGTTPVPIARLRAIWKECALTPQVSLAVTSCLGPCEVANVCLVVTAADTTWLGRLEDAHYDRLADWARFCRDGAIPLPNDLMAKAFTRWKGGPS